MAREGLFSVDQMIGSQYALRSKPRSRDQIFVDARPPDAFQESLFDELKRYVRFSAAEGEALRQFQSTAEPHFERIAAEFYERVREHEGAHKVFRDDAQIERLKRSLVRWMRRLFCGTYGEDYFQETSAIGRVHVRVGLPQHYMFSAMALIRSELQALVRASGIGQIDITQSALDRLLDMELGIMLEAYKEDREASLRRLFQHERELAGLMLAKTEHRYVQAVELSRVLVIGLDTQTRIRMFNREAERVSGYGRLDALGKPFCAVLLPDEEERAGQETLIAAAVRGSFSTDEFQWPMRTRSGKIREIQWQLAYSPSSADDEVVLFVIGQDVTEQNELARRMLQTEKLAAVGTLAAGLAHEIRNPLNGAILHLTFLERGLQRSGQAQPEALEAIEVVKDECRRLSALVHEFLEFARPQPLQRKLVSIRSLCERAVGLVQADADQLGLSLSADLPLTDIELQLDNDKMEQVLLNLLRNSIEALTAGGPGKILLRARRLPRHLMLEVEDNGPGLNDPAAPIFDPFYSTKAHGTGLGLAIAHRIITDHEGSIDVESRPGKTVFRIMLPIALPA